MRLNEDQFFTGIIVTLTLKGISPIPYERRPFIQAMARASIRLQELAAEQQLGVIFRIRPDLPHQHSKTLHQALVNALQQGLVRLDAPLHDWLWVPWAEDTLREMLEQLPGGPDLFSDLTDVFLEHYPPLAHRAPLTGSP